MEKMHVNPSRMNAGREKWDKFVSFKRNSFRIFLTLIMSGFIFHSVILGQEADFKKGYSKANFLASQDLEQQHSDQLQKQKIIFPEPEEEKCGFEYIEKVLQQMYPNRKSTEEFEEWMKQEIATGKYNNSFTVIYIVDSYIL